MKKIVSILLLFSSFHFLGQGLNAYHDFSQNFVVFDDGYETTVETQPVVSFLVGGKCIPYIDLMGYFKIYYDGKVHEITYGPNIEYAVSDNLVTYTLNDQLWVFDNGESKLLSIWVDSFMISDHTVAFVDVNDNKFSVYQNHKILKLEYVLSGVDEIEYKVGENIVAYVFQNNFKANYGGVNFELSFGNEPLSFKVGRDIVAYTDENDQNFKAFYKGEFFIIEDFVPTWYLMGDNMVIYEDQLNNLKAFYKGETRDLSNGEITSVKVQDNVCTFMEQQQFKVFTNGEIKILEYNVPGKTVLENNWVTYIDQTNTLKYFDGVKTQIITSQRIADFYMNINTIRYTNSAGRTRIFYKGKVY